uniref:Corepressor interacting with RBPJ 1 n=1 Tax=Aceria tosichella TaxID=561515 RepID=A0A6G1SFR4_9ACAR
MGKGYNNFMSKKAFHPGSYANQKRIKEAEEKEAALVKHEEEKYAQYRKEQELFQQKSLVSKESKDKLSLSFMYEAPPGTSQEVKSETILKKEIVLKNDQDIDPLPEGSLVWKRTRQP